MKEQPKHGRFLAEVGVIENIAETDIDWWLLPWSQTRLADLKDKRIY